MNRTDMNVKIEPSWEALLKEEFDKPYFDTLTAFVKEEYQTGPVFPPAQNIFRAFDKCPVDAVRVVIIGQDPYHGDGQANGLCFSVNEGVAFPPSLRNIFREIHSDTGAPIPESGNLDRWAEQGVLLLNSVLTVRHSLAASHQNRGWETFTDAVINRLGQSKEGIVYLLWGAYAQRKCAVIDPSHNCILKSAHPSPLSSYRGFFGCKHFSQTNDYLLSNGKNPINW